MWRQVFNFPLLPRKLKNFRHILAREQPATEHHDEGQYGPIDDRHSRLEGKKIAPPDGVPCVLVIVLSLDPERWQPHDDQRQRRILHVLVLVRRSAGVIVVEGYAVARRRLVLPCIASVDAHVARRLMEREDEQAAREEKDAN